MLCFQKLVPARGQESLHGSDKSVIAHGVVQAPESRTGILERLPQALLRAALQLGANPTNPAPFRATAAAMNMPLSVVAIASDEARELYGADLALIRPDQHVAWRGGSADAAATLARTTGHL